MDNEPEFGSWTTIEEVPAIKKGGTIIPLPSHKLMEASEVHLKEMARLMEGELVYRKVRLTYTALAESERLCEKRKCNRLAVKGTHLCGDHSKS